MKDKLNQALDKLKNLGSSLSQKIKNRRQNSDPSFEDDRPGLLSRIKERFSRRPLGDQDTLPDMGGGEGTFTNIRMPGRGQNLPGYLNTLGKVVEKGQGLINPEQFGLYGKMATLLLCAFFLSDLLTLGLEYALEKMIPSQTSIAKPKARGKAKQSRESDYDGIVARNLVNSKGLLPGEDSGPASLAEAKKTSLPITLIGTVIFADPNYSTAAIEDRNKSRIYPVRIRDEIKGLLKVTLVEKKKVTFINLRNRRPEYVEMRDDFVMPKKLTTRAKPSGKTAGIKQKRPNQFLIDRSEVENSMQNLNQILTQARAIPNFENGQPSGYKLFQIVPGSIYDKLGLKNGDIIQQVNGDDINDPAKAFELLQELRESNAVEITIKRNGRPTTMQYNIQ